MFRRDSEEAGDGFVTRVEQGFAVGEAIRYCKIGFDASKYSPDLFQELKVTLPPHISRAVVKRQAEYLAGRLCCMRVLERMGIDAEVRSAHPDRQPVWPVGSTGSISHCGSSAIAVITGEQSLHLGVDIEELGNELIEAHADMFTSSEERERLTNPIDLLIAFSAKEALFKALYPILNFYFGFECASVKITSEARFTIELTCPLGPGFPEHRTWTGHYCKDACAVTTLLMVENPTSPCISSTSQPLQEKLASENNPA